MGARFGGRPGMCPVTEAASDRLVRLPLYYDLSDAARGRVIRAVAAFRPARGVEPVVHFLERLATPDREAA
jgi:dTDP-4-amino-4,6-dideoxygalactose transaminase